MAQKVNPISLRIQSGNNQFSTNWYSNSEYSALLSQDIRIKHYFNEIFKQLNNTKPRIFMTQSPKNTSVHICYLSSTKSRTFRSRKYKIPFNSTKKVYTWKQYTESNSLSSNTRNLVQRLIKEETRGDSSNQHENVFKEALFYNLKKVTTELNKNKFIRWQTIYHNTQIKKPYLNSNKPSLNLSPSENKTNFKLKRVDKLTLRHTFLFSLWLNQNKNNLLRFLEEIPLHLDKETLTNLFSSCFDLNNKKVLVFSKLGLNDSKQLLDTCLAGRNTKMLALPLYKIKEKLNQERLNLLSCKTETSFLVHLLIAALSANLIAKKNDILPFVYKINSLHLLSNWNNFIFLRNLNLFSHYRLKLQIENTDTKNNLPKREVFSSSLVIANKQTLETDTKSPYHSFVESKSIIEDSRVEKNKTINRWKNFLQEIISRSVSCQVNLNWYKVLNESQSASFLAKELSYYLERKIDVRKLIHQICKETKKQRIIQGIRVSCSGRLGGRSKKAQRSKTICIRLGKTSLNLFSSHIDFAKTSVLTRFGLIGIKVWVCYKY